MCCGVFGHVRLCHGKKDPKAVRQRPNHVGTWPVERWKLFAWHGAKIKKNLLGMQVSRDQIQVISQDQSI